MAIHLWPHRAFMVLKVVVKLVLLAIELLLLFNTFFSEIYVTIYQPLLCIKVIDK